jgi:C1A family cysteine protease
MPDLLKIAAIFLFFLMLSEKQSQGQYPFFDSLVDIQIELPRIFDLRSTHRLSPVRVQAAGGCWAAAAMGSLESFMKSSGPESISLSDKNLFYFHGFDSARTTYGNHVMATAYFTRGSGPFIQDPIIDTTYGGDQQPDFLIREARFLPSDPVIIKRTIYHFGGVNAMLHFRPEKLDSVTHIHYSINGRINHVVNLAGWDDTLRTHLGSGVWIAQNSLGSKSGDSGFFYIPYQDENILQYNAVWPEWESYPENLKILYYDSLGQTATYGFEDTVCYALVKFTAPSSGFVKAVGTWSTSEHSEWEASVHQYFDYEKGRLSPAISRSQVVESRFKGYYSANLQDCVSLKQGEDFFIRIRYSSRADTMLVPVERLIEKYAAPFLSRDRCWINPDEKRWPETWYICGETSEYPALKFNLSIKVYFFSAE